MGVIRYSWPFTFPRIDLVITISPNEPVFVAKRNGSNNPFEEVDMPYMLLRSKQGVGRLIRSREDRGMISIMGKELNEEKIREQVKSILPE